MAALPLNRLDLICNSVAEHLGFTALRDVAEAVRRHDSRIIGGHMVGLQVLRWGIDHPRQTSDADLGMLPVAIHAAGLVGANGAA